MVLIIIAQVDDTDRNVLTITFIITILQDLLISPSTGILTKILLLYAYDKGWIKKKKINKIVKDTIGEEVLDIFVRNY